MKSALFVIVSTAVWLAFLANWSLLDGMPRNGFAKMLNGSADKPFAYRLLLPKITGAVESILPNAVSDVLANDVAPVFEKNFSNRFINRFKYDEPGLRAHATQDWSQKSYRVQYVLAVVLMYASMLGTLYVLSEIATLAGANLSATIWMPVVYVLLLPLTYLNGAYYYDFLEQFFVSLLVWATLKGNWVVFVATALIGQLNKETMLLMPFFLIPIISKKTELRRTLLICIGTSAACALLYVAVKAAFASNQGVPMEYNLSNNLAF